jgi:hypothetical protein
VNEPAGSRRKSGQLKCPIQGQVRASSRSGQNFLKAMRRLRSAHQQCSRCPSAGDCSLLLEYSLQIDLVMDELLSEWGWS